MTYVCLYIMLPLNPSSKDMQQVYQSIESHGEPSISYCRKVVFTILAIAILILSIYGNSFNSSWHFDDEPNITDNPNLHLKEITLENIKRTIFSDRNNPHVLYRPIACLSFGLNHYFGGLDAFGYHLVNIFIHLISSIFLFLFIYHTLNLPSLKTKYTTHSYSIALLSTILWAINPIQTQAVTYIVQRMASMAGMFYIMSMYFYLKARTTGTRNKKAISFIVCFVSFVMAFGSKENAAMLPLSIFLYEILLLQEITVKNIRKNLNIFFIVTGAILILGFIYIYIHGGNMFSFLNGYENRGFTLGQRLLTEPRVIIYYISLLFYPMPNRLCITHVISPSHGLLHPPTTLLSILLILFILSAAAVKSKKWPLICYCIIFFFLNHVIESAIFPLELIFEHRNYLPSMLFFVPVSILAVRAIQYYSAKPGMQSIISAFIVLIIIGFGHSTFMRNFIWKTEESLWIDAVDKNPNSIRAHHNLGRYYADNGATEKAILEYRYALKLKPETYGEKSYLTHYNLGLAYMAVAEDKKAMQQFQKAIDLFPRFADAYCDMAIIMTKKGNYRKAYDNLITSLTYNKNSPQAHNNLGCLLIKRKDYKNAIIELQKALKLKKGYNVALRNMGIAYRHEKEFQKAIYYFRSAINKNPRDILTRLHLAETCVLMGKHEIASRVVSRMLDVFGPNKLYSKLKGVLTGNSFEEIPSKAIIAPLLEKAYIERGKSFEQMGNELSEFADND